MRNSRERGYFWNVLSTQIEAFNKGWNLKFFQAVQPRWTAKLGSWQIYFTLYSDFKKNDSLRPFNDQSWRNGKNCISTSLMFPKRIYRSGSGCDFWPTHFEIPVADPDSVIFYRCIRIFKICPENVCLFQQWDQLKFSCCSLDCTPI